MDKMNQVSVTEFMSKSKEEMYDMAVEMVEKYNRLVDICNDSAERIAELIVRHKVYTSALKNDIASKDTKIERLEKEIEGRKKAFNELKEENDTVIEKLKEERDKCKTWNSHLREELAGKGDEIEHWRRSFYNARYNIEKLRKENEKENKEDDHGREGFERYIKYIISTEETKFKAELNRKFSEEVSKISRERTEEELAKMKGIPCGEDSIE